MDFEDTNIQISNIKGCWLTLDGYLYKRFANSEQAKEYIEEQKKLCYPIIDNTNWGVYNVKVELIK